MIQTIYKTSDGRNFSDLRLAQDYEEKCQRTKLLKKMEDELDVSALASTPHRGMDVMVLAKIILDNQEMILQIIRDYRNDNENNSSDLETFIPWEIPAPFEIIQYNSKLEQLSIKIQDYTYIFEHVPQQEFNNFRTAKFSVNYFNAEIRGQYNRIDRTIKETKMKPFSNWV